MQKILNALAIAALAAIALPATATVPAENMVIDFDAATATTAPTGMVQGDSGPTAARATIGDRPADGVIS